MNKILSFCVYFSLAIFLILIFPKFLKSGEIVDRVLAIVEDEIILQSEVEVFAQMYALQLKIDPRLEPEKFDEIRRQSLEQLIEQYVLLAKAIEDSIEITEEEVDMVLDQQINEYIQQFGSQEEMVKNLGFSVKKLKSLYREDVRKKGMVDKFRQKKMEEVKITGEELEEFYNTMRDSLPEMPDRYEISYILKAELPGDNSRRRALEKAEMILQKIKEGADFSELAKEYSDEKVSGSDGGVIGFIKKGDLMKSFDEAAFALESGEVSDIVETPLGFHIIRALEKKDDTTNLQHILIEITKSEEDDAEIANFLIGIKKRAENGEPFEDLAREYSDEPDAKKTGGELGWIYLENIQPEFEVFNQIIPYLTVGEISEPFKTNFGYLIVKLNDKIEKHILTLEKDRETIEQIARGQKSNDEFLKFLEDAKKEVYIEIKDPL